MSDWGWSFGQSSVNVERTHDGFMITMTNGTSQHGHLLPNDMVIEICKYLVDGFEPVKVIGNELYFNNTRNMRLFLAISNQQGYWEAHINKTRAEELARYMHDAFRDEVVS